MKEMKLKDIDVTCDFSLEPSLNFWENFWNRREGLGEGRCDPDCYSLVLKEGS